MNNEKGENIAQIVSILLETHTVTEIIVHERPTRRTVFNRNGLRANTFIKPYKPNMQQESH